MDRRDEYCNTFKRVFAEKIVSGTPENGQTRVQIAEQMMRAMNSDRKDSDLKYVSEMIESIEDDASILPSMSV